MIIELNDATFPARYITLGYTRQNLGTGFLNAQYKWMDLILLYHCYLMLTRSHKPWPLHGVRFTSTP